jgi:polar amino acid transport system substrate-binding protein
VSGDLAPSGTLRAAINLGNPVLAQGTASAPTGVTVDIARELARRLSVPLQLVCVDAARESFDAMQAGAADICFLAIEPEREGTVAFTAPYVVIEGVFAVRVDSNIAEIADVDRESIRVGVTRGSAYDLFLSRTLQHAEVVRSDESVAASRDPSVQVVAGIRQPISAFVLGHPGFRLLDGRFMEIRQALGTTNDRAPATIAYLREFIEELKATGFVAEALRRANQLDAAVAPAA